MTHQNHEPPHTAETLYLKLSELPKSRIDRELDMLLLAAADKPEFLFFIEFDLLPWYISIDSAQVSPNAPWREITRRWLQHKQPLLEAAEGDTAAIVEAVKSQHLQQTVENYIHEQHQDEFLSLTHALEFLGISKPTLNRLRQEGKINTYNPTPGRVMFLKEELIKYMKGNGK